MSPGREEGVKDQLLIPWLSQCLHQPSSLMSYFEQR